MPDSISDATTTSITTLNIITISITALSITIPVKMWHTSLHKCYAECRNLAIVMSIVMLNVLKVSLIMLNLVMLTILIPIKIAWRNDFSKNLILNTDFKYKDCCLFCWGVMVIFDEYLGRTLDSPILLVWWWVACANYLWHEHHRLLRWVYLCKLSMNSYHKSPESLNLPCLTLWLKLHKYWGFWIRK